MTTDEREQLTHQLEEAKREQRRCMGGVDPSGCIAAAQRIRVLRNQLRDDTAMFAHFERIAKQPQR